MRNPPSQSPAATPIEKLPLRLFNQVQQDSTKRSIKRVLIANRGEIACRVISTCRKLEITSVAIYTDPDASSLHVREANEAIALGPIDGPDGNPHQNIKLLIQLAVSHNIDAIHPGYGYLSENADFSEAVQAAGLIFLGPSPRSMAVLGDKRSAKLYLQEYAPEIPLIPGYNGEDQSLDRLTIEADRVGFPILIKASAGGGGKGMRIVRQREQLQDELERAKSEAQRSFGSSDCILERYIQKSKHIEIQILGDSHGTVVSLLDRECSIQRRHQKVVEEAPSPWLKPDLRVKMSNSASAIGKLLAYESAGTVEFIVDIDTSEYFFLEVNTRIQVEHPITEETTGVDVVAAQIFVASGGDLQQTGYFKNGRAPQVGHAIEVRLCAEDPLRDFMPDLGTIWRWDPASNVLSPGQTKHVRFETGIATGSQVSVFFDSMISKIVVWAPTRLLAIEKMAKMLANTVCIGVRTNQLFLQSCLLHPEFQKVDYTTNFIPDLLPQLNKNPYVDDISKTQELLSFIAPMIRRQQASLRSTPSSAFHSIPRSFTNQRGDPTSLDASVVQIPLRTETVFVIEWPTRPTKSPSTTVNILTINEEVSKPTSSDTNREVKPSVQLARSYNKLSTQVRALHSSKTKDSKAIRHQVTLEITRTQTFQATPTLKWQLLNFSVSIDAQRYHAYAASFLSSTTPSDVAGSQRLLVHFPALGSSIEYNVSSLLTYGESLRQDAGVAAGGVSDASPKAPMPCKVLNVLKKNGDVIKIGEVAVVVESMKMEMNILAAVEGKFEAKVQKGQAVDEGAVLFTIT